MDRKATERVYAGGKDTEREEDGLDSADMEEDVHDPGNYRGITLLRHHITQSSTETVEEGFSRTDQEKSR